MNSLILIGGPKAEVHILIVCWHLPLFFCMLPLSLIFNIFYHVCMQGYNYFCLQIFGSQSFNIGTNVKIPPPPAAASLPATTQLPQQNRNILHSPHYQHSTQHVRFMSSGRRKGFIENIVQNLKEGLSKDEKIKVSTYTFN